MECNDKKYLYEVHPVRPVISPVLGRRTRCPFSAELTLDQVKELAQWARVYRRFPDYEAIVPVTGLTREELHRPKYYEDSVVEEKKVEEPPVKATVVELPAEGEPEEAPFFASEMLVQTQTTTECTVEQQSKDFVVETGNTDVVDTGVVSVASTNEASDLIIDVSGTATEETENTSDLEVEESQDAEKTVAESGNKDYYSSKKNNKFHKKH